MNIKKQKITKKKSTNKLAVLLALTTILALAMTALTGCNSKELSGEVKIAALKGPTGMGMVQLLDQGNYEVGLYQSPDEIVAKIVSGEVDLAAVPSNLASVLYNKTKGNIKAVSVITLGVLYIMENGDSITSVADLKGKTIIASGKGGTPEYALQKILENAGLKIGEGTDDVKIQWLANHTEVVGKMIAEDGAVALVPEPFVTIAKAQGGPNQKVALDVNEEWKSATGEDLPMGVLIAQKSFADERAADLDIVLAQWADSVTFVNENPEEGAALIEEKGIFDKAAVAEKAIPNCNIVCYNSAGTKAAMKSFLQILFEMNPQSVGGTVPGEEFYY
ncbi:MAG TPA: MqnA/MqnD/SBP family protein [Anaerovoracaceae bacterium]|nr:MqnA/MqnD/SBP family protein [Anaerovoracaceae bacterium]